MMIGFVSTFNVAICNKAALPAVVAKRATQFAAQGPAGGAMALTNPAGRTARRFTHPRMFCSPHDPMHLNPR
jgi:hypothetical protein